MKLGVHIHDIDYILLSHLHLDHCAEVAPFLFATKYPGFKRTKPLVLAGGTGILSWFERLNNTFDRTLDLPEACFRIVELGDRGGFDLIQERIRLDYAQDLMAL